MPSPALADLSFLAWLKEHGIKTEKGEPLGFYNHPFLFDIYRDLSFTQVIMKPAQVGMSTMMNLKPFWLMDKLGLDIIYTLPTDADVIDFVSSKTNRLIAQNPYLQELTKDRDTIEQKQLRDNIIYFRGTFTKKAAMMIPADLLIHDELDASKQEIVADYETRLKHSKWKWRWYFSHPSMEGIGVHKLYTMTDQKNWFVTCPGCNHEQTLVWPDSINRETERYICRKCGVAISDNVRRRGKWKPTIAPHEIRYKGWSGYSISSLMCPWVTAHEIIEAHDTKDPEYFATKVLGLPYSGGGNKIPQDVLEQNLTKQINSQTGRIVIGVDTGVKIHYVVGNSEGLFYYNETDGYDEIEKLLTRYPKAVAVIDQGGDLISPRKLREKYPGRIFLCYFRKDRKAMQLVAWGEGNEDGKVIADRNRCIQLIVDEFTDKRIPLQGNAVDWRPWLDHYKNVYRVKVEDSLGILQNKWERSGPDHFVLATTYWRIGMTRYGNSEGAILGANPGLAPRPTLTVTLDKKIVTSKMHEFLFAPKRDDDDDNSLFI